MSNGELKRVLFSQLYLLVERSELILSEGDPRLIKPILEVESTLRNFCKCTNTEAAEIKGILVDLLYQLSETSEKYDDRHTLTAFTDLMCSVVERLSWDALPDYSDWKRKDEEDE